LKEETPSKHAKLRGLTISLKKAGEINKIQTYTPDGLYKLFNNPNDIDHKKFNMIIDNAQIVFEEGINL